MNHKRNLNPINIKYEENGNNSNRNQEIKPIDIDIAKSLKQTKLIIQDIEIYFPYTPYENQVIYMTKVIEALSKRSIAGLESPTGTGKTLCLLCACLGWLRTKRASMIKEGSKDNPPKLFYSSRTHSQLSGVMKELKKTCYLPSTSILSSRDNMCVNSQVNNYKGNSLKVKCKQMRYRKQCKYFFGSERLPFYSYDNCDIEELNRIGSKSGFCPFFFERRKKDNADIVFLPYNYVFDFQIKSMLKINLAQSILVIDEAHNVESVCEESASCQLSFKTIDEILLDLKGVKQLVNPQSDTLNKESVFNDITSKDIANEEEILHSIKAFMKSMHIKSGKFWPDIGLILSPKDFFDIFFEGSKSKGNQGLDPSKLNENISLLTKIEVGLSDELQKSSIIFEYIQILTLLKVLVDNHLAFIQSNDSNPLNNYCNNYRFFINDIDDSYAASYLHNKKINGQSAKIRTLFLYCFNPGFGFKNILNEQLQSVIITSGTLSPIESVESELKCSFETKLENKHVVDKAQVSLSILTNAIRRKDMQFKFDASNKNNNAMLDELGHTIIELCRITPGGVLVFFTSFSFMNQCYNLWNENQLILELTKVKEVYKDMHDNQKNKVVLKNYTEANKKDYKGKGAVLFSVFRGTTSEGIDFSDDYARMVILIGIPYPNLGDVRIQLKKEFLDDFNKKHFQFVQNKNIKRMTGSDWYTQTATKTVNQALGRVIRHVNDYGSMVLIDVRFKEFINRKLFSSWLKDIGKVYVDNKLYSDIKGFYEKMKIYIKKPTENSIRNSSDKSNKLKEIEKYEEQYNKDNTYANNGWIKKRNKDDEIQNHTGFKVSDDIQLCIDESNHFSTSVINNHNCNDNKNKLNTKEIKGDLRNVSNDKEKISIDNKKKINERTNQLGNSIKQSNNESSKSEHEQEQGEQKEDYFQNKTKSMIKKLLDLKDRSKLNSLYEKYNMKLQYEREEDKEAKTPTDNTKKEKSSISSISNSINHIDTQSSNEI